MANMQRDAGKEQFWRGVLKRQAASGLSVRAFCQRERLTESSFYAWRRTLAERDHDTASKRQLPVFLPVAVTDVPAGHAAIEIHLAGGRVLRLPELIPARRLAELVAALEATALEAHTGAAEAAR